MLQRPSCAVRHGPDDRRHDPWRQATLLAALLFAACGPGPLAEADGSRLTVDAAARLIATHSTVPGDSEVVRVVAELWVDYTLLSAQLERDGTLASLDVEIVTEQPLNEIMMGRLRDEAVPVDTVVTDEELTARFATEMPGARATASQILLLHPRGATVRQRDSVRLVAEELHLQLTGGADFATLARSYSGDPGSGPVEAAWAFERGQMLAPVDDAVFSLRPGQLGDPVETQLGYHLLRLDALDVPDLEEVGDEFRLRIQHERIAQAEAEYVTTLDSAYGLSLAEGALDIARALAASPPSSLSRGAAGRDLVTWDGGAYSVGEYLEILENAPEGFGESVATASDADLEIALRQLGQEQLIIAEARSRGLAPTEEERDSVMHEARSLILGWAEAIGLVPGSGAETGDSTAGADLEAADSGVITPAPPTSTTAAERVEAALIRVISGQQRSSGWSRRYFSPQNQAPGLARDCRVPDRGNGRAHRRDRISVACVRTTLNHDRYE